MSKEIDEITPGMVEEWVWQRGFRAGIEAVEAVIVSKFRINPDGERDEGYSDACDDILEDIRAVAPAAPVPSAPEGYALVPLRMTKAMHDLTSEEGWDWAGLLAVAGAITEDQHFDLIAAPEPTDEMMERLSAWWRSWDTGLSSEAIALFLGMGVKSEHTPSDAADLGRCLRLLDKIPEWRPRLREMRDAGGAWPFIVDRWPELEAHYKLENWDVVYATLNAAHREHRARFEPVEEGNG